jgi:hypothetical protein
MRLPVLALALVVLPLAAAAQPLQTAGRDGAVSGSCGQPVALTYRLPQPLDVTPAAPLRAEIARAEPVYLEFGLDAGARFVALSDAQDGGDPYLSLFDSRGSVLAEDDDGAGSLNALIDLDLAAGRYCVQIRRHSGGSAETSAMILRVAAGAEADDLAAEVVTDEPDLAALCQEDAFAAMINAPLSPGFGTLALNATVEVGARRDWRLTVAEATDFQAEATSNEFDTVLQLVDEDGAQLAHNDDAPGLGTGSRVALRLAPGSYCLSVAGFGEEGGEVEVAITDTPADPVLPPLSQACSDPETTQAFPATAAAGMGRQSITADLARGGRSEWALDVAEAIELQIDARSLALDPVLAIVDAGGTIVEENDDGPYGTDSRIVRSFAPGRYCLAVTDLGGNPGTIELAVSDDPADPGADLLPPDGPIAAGPSPCGDDATTAAFGAPLAPGADGQRFDARVEAGARQDLRLSIPERTRVRLAATSSGMDTVLRLYDGRGMLVDENDDSPEGGSDSLIETTLPGGDYCLTLEGFGGSGGEAFVDVVAKPAGSVGGEPATAALDWPGDAAEVLDLGTLETVLQSSLPGEDATAWASFELTEGAAVRVDAVSPSGNFVLAVFTDAGSPLATTRGRIGLRPTGLDLDLPAGRYRVGLELEPGAVSRLRNLTITRKP